MLIRVLSLLIGAILGLSNSGVVWGAKDGIRLPGNGLIAFADAPGSKLGPEPWPDAHIFTVNPDGQNRKQLTTGPGGYLWPVWSPDGDEIACMRLINDAPEIWILGKDGTARRKITVGFLPAWSPDGKKLAFFRQLGNVRQVFVVDLASGTERQLTNQGSNAAAVWSPRGNKIAFWSGDEKGFGQLWVMNSDGTQKKQLTFPEKNDYTPRAAVPTLRRGCTASGLLTGRGSSTPTARSGSWTRTAATRRSSPERQRLHRATIPSGRLTAPSCCSTPIDAGPPKFG